MMKGEGNVSIIRLQGGRFWSALGTLVLGAACSGLAYSAVTPADARAADRQIGETQVFATVPYPGNPGGLAVDGRTLYVDTSAANLDRPYDGSDDIFAYDLRTGELQAEGPN